MVKEGANLHACEEGDDPHTAIFPAAIFGSWGFFIRTAGGECRLGLSG
jgi:hypothetical protein